MVKNDQISPSIKWMCRSDLSKSYLSLRCSLPKLRPDVRLLRNSGPSRRWYRSGCRAPSGDAGGAEGSDASGLEGPGGISKGDRHLEIATPRGDCGGTGELNANETDPRSVNGVWDVCDGDGVRRSPVEPQKAEEAPPGEQHLMSREAARWHDAGDGERLWLLPGTEPGSVDCAAWKWCSADELVILSSGANVLICGEEPRCPCWQKQITQQR